MFEVVRKIYSLLDHSERRRFLVLILAMIAVGLIDVAGIASIMPFMAVVSSPEVVSSNHYLHWVYQTFGFSSENHFLIFLGLLVFFMLLFSNAMKAMVLWLDLNFAHFRLYSLSRRLFSSYLSQPYGFFINQNTSILHKNILQEVAKFTHEVLRPCTQIFSRLVAALFIFGLLLVIDPLLALIIFSSMGTVYLSIYFLAQRRLVVIGEERFEANAQRSKIAGEAFGGIKDLKILNREAFFFDQFSEHAHKAESRMVAHGLFSQLPSFFMEVVAFGGILIIVIYYLVVKQNIGQTLPVIALYAFAGYRLMPALQGIFSAASLLRFNLPVLDRLHQDINANPCARPILSRQQVPILPFKERIQLQAVTFSYPGSDCSVLKSFDLSIEKNTSIGLVGATGAGKTTVVDLLLGLFSPDQGQLLVDGVPVRADMITRWQKNIGYVPQSIFLSDDSLANNIAFGVPADQIDMAAVERAGKIANIHDFVVGHLPDGYQTPVGERGVRLSGGQRQRIGIARALYRDPAVLIMDEATSALDGVTEEVVTQAIRTLAGKKTIITIAHRLTTLKDCDLIYVLEEGRIVEQGSYEELSGSSNRFRAMSRSAI